MHVVYSIYPSAVLAVRSIFTSQYVSRYIDMYTIQVLPSNQIQHGTGIPSQVGACFNADYALFYKGKSHQRQILRRSRSTPATFSHPSP